MPSKIKISLSVPEEFITGVKRLESILNFELTDEDADITIEAEKTNKTGVKIENKKAVITYAKKHLFFRELGIVLEHYKEPAFESFEDDQFKTVSVMIDASRGAVPTVSGFGKLIDYLAVMGYSMAMLYTEDIVEIKERPYFGYMRGRYTKEEMKAIDDYAFEYGIEIIPCLECYGHMEKYLMWGEADPIKDTSSVLLARSEKTFDFLDQYIGTVADCFRSKRIHIGMDEAWDMGRGRFLTKNGYVPPFEIFNEYMERLITITNKYGLTPMMWSDMYFRVCTNNNGYYNKDIVIPPEVSSKIPKEVELIFWHYGEMPECDDYMLKKHKALDRNILYCGGLWSWIGHFPEHNYAMESTRFSLEACRNNDIKEAMISIWTNDNAECDIFANLFGLSYFAELCYDKDASEEKLRSRFESSTGGDWDAFYTMSLYHNSFGGENDDYSGSNWPKRFLGKPLFWQDIMEGLYDSHLFNKSMCDHYAACATFQKEKLEKELESNGRWAKLYDFAYKVFDYMAIKTLIAENLVPAYKKGDKDSLNEIASFLLPLLKEKTVAVHEAHKSLWFDKLKLIGWANLDVRYGGMASRCDTAKYIIERYLSGEYDRLEELEEPRLHKGLSGFVHYSSIATANLKI